MKQPSARTIYLWYPLAVGILLLLLGKLYDAFSWTGSLETAGKVLGLLVLPVPLPLLSLILLLGGWVWLAWSFIEKIGEKNVLRHELSVLQQQLDQAAAKNELSDDENEVMELLAIADGRCEVGGLHSATGFTRVRLEHTIRLLVDKRFASSKTSRDEKRWLMLEDNGRAYVVKHDLDTLPRNLSADHAKTDKATQAAALERGASNVAQEHRQRADSSLIRQAHAEGFNERALKGSTEALTASEAMQDYVYRQAQEQRERDARALVVQVGDAIKATAFQTVVRKTMRTSADIEREERER